jgi:hypothetical protein
MALRNNAAIQSTAFIVRKIQMKNTVFLLLLVLPLTSGCIGPAGFRSLTPAVSNDLDEGLPGGGGFLHAFNEHNNRYEGILFIKVKNDGNISYHIGDPYLNVHLRINTALIENGYYIISMIDNNTHDHYDIFIHYEKVVYSIFNPDDYILNFLVEYGATIVDIAPKDANYSINAIDFPAGHSPVPIIKNAFLKFIKIKHPKKFSFFYTKDALRKNVPSFWAEMEDSIINLENCVKNLNPADECKDLIAKLRRE